MMKRALILLLLIPALLMGKAEGKKTREKIVRAYRTHEKIKIDGVLNERVWKNPPVEDFVMLEPKDGGKPTEKTQVWVAYDDNALYVAARLYDSHPEKIVGRLGRRDARLDSDWFTFAVDPYFDRRSGYLFMVNPAGSIRDAQLFNDSWNSYSWDGVWDWAVKRDNKGWCVEMKIPFSQLRFQKREKYVWGVNFERKIIRKNEEDSFVWIPRKDRFSVYVSRFAKLVGIEGIKPKPLAEAVPYIVGDVKFSPKEEGNPFATGHSYYGNAGADFKFGLKSNLTLTATVNPDFGQVEVDPAVVNLTAYETYYEEKRPFFIEGSSIFDFGQGGVSMGMNINWGDPEFFYSRRIGAPPHGRARGQYTKIPDRTTILGAAKITGKVGEGWNLGTLFALTSKEYAEVINQGQEERQEVEPMSFYGVSRLQKEFNGGRQGLGFIATSVFRNINDPSLSSILAKDALVFGIDGWSFLDREKKWVAAGWFGASRVEGEKDYIFSLQHSPLHYFQRPDASHLHLDPEATSLSGWAGRFTLNKERGNWIFGFSAGAISPGFEINDLGFQFRGDVIHLQSIGGYLWTKPGKIFRLKFLATGLALDYDFGGNILSNMSFLFFQGKFNNFWGTQISIGYKAQTYDRDLTRGGPLALSPEGLFMEGGLWTDRSKKIVVTLEGKLIKIKGGEKSVGIGLILKLKPASNLSISLGPEYMYRYSISQWVTRVEDPTSPTYGARYVFADIVQHTISSSIRINWSFTPRLSLQAYLQPFIASGDYSRFKELAKARSYDFNIYGEGNSTISCNNGVYTVDPDGEGPAQPFSFFNPDFNIRSMRGTVVLRWEYRPGSVLYLVWTQNRMDYANTGILDLGRDFVDMIKAPGDNIFLLKIAYRWGN